MKAKYSRKDWKRQLDLPYRTDFYNKKKHWTLIILRASEGSSMSHNLKWLNYWTITLKKPGFGKDRDFKKKFETREAAIKYLFGRARKIKGLDEI